MKTEREAKPEAGKSADFSKSAVHLVFGADEYLVSAQTKKIVDQLCPADQQALGLDTIDGRCSTIDEAVSIIRRCIEGLRTVGFFGSGRVVLLRDPEMLATDDEPGKYDETKEAVAQLVDEIKAGLPQGQYLVISAGKVHRGSALYKTCKGLGAVHEYDPPEKGREAEQQVREVAHDQFRAAGLSVAHDAMESFLARTGNDTRQIVQEVEKLRVYVKDRKTVTTADVQNIVAASREAMGWDLADAFGRRDLPGALRVLHQLLYQKVSPIPLIMGLGNRVRDLIVMRECIDRRWMQVTGSAPWFKAAWSAAPEAETALSGLATDPRAMNPFRAGILADQARKFTIDELVRIQREVVQAHVKLVSSSLDNHLILELLLMKAMGKERRAA